MDIYGRKRGIDNRLRDEGRENYRKNREDGSGREGELGPSSGNGMIRRRIERRKKKKGKARRIRGIWTKESKKEFTRLVGSRIEGDRRGMERVEKEDRRSIRKSRRTEERGKSEEMVGWRL